MAFVTVRIKGIEDFTRVTLEGDRVVVGRASASGLPIKHTSISREHFALIRDGETWVVEDLGSANGTKVGVNLLTGRHILAEKDIIKAGKARLTFHAGNLADAEAAVEVAGVDEEDPAGPVRTMGADDPPEATRCTDCQGWFSIAHRLSGDSMTCPHCGRSQVVPDLIAAS